MLTVQVCNKSVTFITIGVRPTIFPDGTSQIWNLDKGLLNFLQQNNNSIPTIIWDFEIESEFIHLAQLTMLIRRYSLNGLVNLEMPYLPYARQDKHISNETTWALTCFAELINNLKFYSVTVNDAHSSAYQMIASCINISPKFRFIELYKYDVIIFPDHGAMNRYSKQISSDITTIVAEKVRDQSSGHITTYSLPDINLAGKKVLVLDDLCDGGMTFTILGAKLLEHNVREAHLYVTHGIFSKGLGELSKYYSKILCVNILNKKEEIYQSLLIERVNECTKN